MRILSLALLASLGCRDAVAPESLFLVPVHDIDVVAIADRSDAVDVGFSYTLQGCEVFEALEIVQRSEEVTFSVWARTLDDTLLDCAFPQAHRVTHLLPPGSRNSTYFVRFRQEGGDVVRTIAAPP